MGGKMLQEVRQDLSDVVQVCEGKKKQTNYLRTLISDLVKGKKNNNTLEYYMSRKNVAWLKICLAFLLWHFKDVLEC